MQLRAFQGEEHLPFIHAGEGMAALLVHGFPGTPAEMRPLANSLHRTGVTVESLLLPGFGPQIETLAERKFPEWIDAVQSSLSRLRQSHDRVVLVGFSMGGAISMHVAASLVRPDAMVLLAPFWQLGEPWQQFLWPLLRVFMRHFRPFEKADFRDPRLRRDILKFMPDADLDDPETQTMIREISLPFGVLDQLRLLGRSAYHLAPRLELPIMVVQGREDDVVHPRKTQRLVSRFPEAIRYCEVSGDHQLIHPDHPAWAEVEALVVRFIDEYR